MKNKILLVIMSTVLALGSTFALANKYIPSNLAAEPVKPKQEEVKPVEPATTEQAKPAEKAKEKPEPKINEAEYAQTSSLDIVNNPNKYLGKKVKMGATFDKFSTLGLDYKPAFRDGQKYISFLIKRDDVKDHTIPLSEMKIFVLRTTAEKFIDLESGDVITIYGKVFSTALGDPWVDVDKLVIVEKKTKPTDKEKDKANENSKGKE